ncbi:MAG: helix-turn-helix domain-containing protein [Ramlibacter sp.]|nr:helix-turn-helix domain-containing protein [Ramlibacter sp.]
MDAYGTRTLKELADKVEAPENTVRNWHKRDSVPLERLRAASAATGLPFEWLAEGKKSHIFLNQMAKELAKSAAGDASGQAQKVTGKGGDMHSSPTAEHSYKRAGGATLQQNVARDEGPDLYAGVNRPSGVDANLLAGVLGAVLAELGARGLQLKAPKLAELVALIYEDTVGVNDRDRAEQVRRISHRYLRLVA